MAFWVIVEPTGSHPGGSERSPESRKAATRGLSPPASGAEMLASNCSTHRQQSTAGQGAGRRVLRKALIREEKDFSRARHRGEAEERNRHGRLPLREPAISCCRRIRPVAKDSSLRQEAGSIRAFTRREASDRMSVAVQSVAPGDYFEFAPDCVLDADYGVHLEYKCREHRAELVNREWVVPLHQHMPAPLAHTNYEKLDLEIGWRLPLTKHLKDALLGVFILYGRALRAFEPADYVFHLLLRLWRWPDRSRPIQSTLSAMNIDKVVQKKMSPFLVLTLRTV